jgi:hypothetical protein
MPNALTRAWIALWIAAALLACPAAATDYWMPELLGPTGARTWRARWLGIRIDLPSGPVELFTPGGDQETVLKAVRANMRPRGYRAFDMALKDPDIRRTDVESARRSFMQITEPSFLIRLRRAATLVHRRPVRIVIHPEFHGWPNTRNGVLHIGGAPLKEEPLHDLRGVLMHEAAHLGDGITPCRLEHERYGPDRSHYLHEVITPAAAFQEGWANFVSSWLVGSRLRDQVALPPTELFLETEEPGQYTRLGSDQLGLGDLVSNEVYVAAILQALAQDLGLEAVTQAMQALPVTECPTVADLLTALGLARPEAGARILRSVWKATRGRGETYEFGRLLSGHLPLSRRGDQLLRPRPGSRPQRTTRWEEPSEDEEEQSVVTAAADHAPSPFAVTDPVDAHEFLPRTQEGVAIRGAPPRPAEDHHTLELFGR